jgi:hypothetical protein
MPIAGLTSIGKIQITFFLTGWIMDMEVAVGIGA